MTRKKPKSPETAGGTAGRRPLRIVLRVDFSPRDRLGRGKAELLENIVRTGSISAAGREMDMSYRRAWLLVEEMNTMFNDRVVESRRGGTLGGGAALTPFGEELLRRFRAMEARAAAAPEPDLDWLERHRSENGI